MRRTDFFYELPEEMIAQTPVEPRDSAKLLVYRKESGEIEHKYFYDIADYLQAGDLLVANNTRVIPARLYGTKSGTGGKIEFLLQKRLSIDSWEALVKPAKRAREGAEFRISDELSAVITKFLPDGGRIIRFKFEGVFEDILSRTGETPLPHYIKKELSDPERYQTVYSAEPGSSAAPTAGLHFTPSLIEKLKAKGVEWAEVTLHVGAGTFRPVAAENITDHKMHSEYYEISCGAAEAVNRAKNEGRRVIAVGTTSVRVLESAAQTAAKESGNSECFVRESGGETDIFIYPGYGFKVVDAIITNFHLPESTLIMLVSAFIGRENTMAMYKTAVEKKYRFFSFGDASLII